VDNFWNIESFAIDLEKPVNPKFIKKNYKNQNYVPASLTIREANMKLKKWSCEVMRSWSEKMLDYDIVFFALVRVTVPGMGWRECIGGASFRDHCYAQGIKKPLSQLEDGNLQAGQSCDMYKKAAVDGTKKALSYFGICEEVYWPSDAHEAYTKAPDGNILLNGKRIPELPGWKFPELVDYQQLGDLGDNVASIIQLLRINTPEDLTACCNKAGIQTPINSTNVAKFKKFMKEYYEEDQKAKQS